MMEFVEFPKMGRLFRDCIITEKIDGTNSSINIINVLADEFPDDPNIAGTHGGFNIRVGSRQRWITPKDDNFGFANWVVKNLDCLIQLGEGNHFGEWWGKGIQRGYGLNERRFSLFNADRWAVYDTEPQPRTMPDPRTIVLQDIAPECCHIVPILYKGPFGTDIVRTTVETLKNEGSRAVEGFMRPEGVVTFHFAAEVGFKTTVEKDELPKSLVK